jgi:eukaryotic-like serine/threonine-protein kinase
MATPAADRVVADRYTLKAPLGRGGMGVVWHAHDAVLDRAVAVKEVVLPPTMPDEERRAAHARVRREARAAARLNHPGAVTLYDVVQDQGHPFIVMELVPASTLADLVRTGGPLPPGRVAEIGAQLAAALEAAHRAGIVHRDVKPGNVMVAEDGGVKLADFGVASLQGDPQLTATGLVLGSPAYMAPEQAAGEPSGPPADFWALGATMFFAVEGVPPFDKGASIATLAAVVNEDPQPMRRAGPLAPLVRALLTKDPAARPPGPRVRAELERLAAATSVTQELPAHPQAPPASTTARLPAIPLAAPLATPPADAADTPPADAAATPPVSPAATPPAAASAASEPAAEPTGPPAAAPASAEPPEATGPPAAEPAAEPAAPAAEAPAEPAPPAPAAPAAEPPGPRAGEPARPEPVVAGPGPGAAGPEPGASGAGFGVRLPAAGERPASGAAGGARPVPPVAPGRPGDRRLLGYLALVALVVLAGMLIAWAASTLGSDGRGGAAPDTSRGGATATTRAPGTPGAAGQLPAGWTSFTNRRGNDVVGVPPGWRARARESSNAAVVEEPDGARRVFTVRSANPANPLPEASRDYRAFAAQSFEGFREIRFDEDATYAGRSGAVVFEYEALRDGRLVHVSHINFKGRTWGYNVEFVTPAAQWDSSQELARQFEQAFRALG